MTDNKITPTQADRDRLAARYREISKPGTADEIEAGEMDDHPSLLMLAAHRLASTLPTPEPSEVGELIERLRRKVQVMPPIGGGSISADGTSTCYITDDGKRLVNPDGPEAADTLATMQERVGVLEADLASCERALARRTDERNLFAERLRQAAADLRTVGDDYPGSSCRKWCHERADAALTPDANEKE